MYGDELKEHIVVHVTAPEEYDKLMLLLEEKGYVWGSGSRPTSHQIFYTYKEQTAIHIGENGHLSYGSVPFYGRYSNYTIISFNEYVKPKQPQNLNASVIEAIRRCMKMNQ